MGMNMPKALLYTKSHERIKLIDETTAMTGLTDYARSIEARNIADKEGFLDTAAYRHYTSSIVQGAVSKKERNRFMTCKLTA